VGGKINLSQAALTNPAEDYEELRFPLPGSGSPRTACNLRLTG